MADRRATITEGDRRRAHNLANELGGICLWRFDSNLHADACGTIAQALADTREAEAKRQGQAMLEVAEECARAIRDLQAQREAAEARASILVRAMEEETKGLHNSRQCSAPWVGQCGCHIGRLGRALAEYAEAGAKKP